MLLLKQEPGACSRRNSRRLARTWLAQAALARTGEARWPELQWPSVAPACARSASSRRKGSTPARSSSSSHRSCCWKAWWRSRSWSAHWNQVTRRLSEGMARDIGLGRWMSTRARHLGKDDIDKLVDIAQNRFSLSLAGSAERRPADARSRSPSSISLDRALVRRDLRNNVKRPFWIDTVGQSRHVEIRVKLDNAILRFVAQRSQAFAVQLAHLPDLDGGHLRGPADGGRSCSCATRSVPMLRLAEARRRLRQRPARVRTTSVRAAPREVRQAAQAFLEMRDRIRHHVDQRTTMLAGVSHDLRTVLTRFKLELALLPRQPRVCRAAERRQRNAAHARGLPGLRQGRRRRGGGADRRAASCWTKCRRNRIHRAPRSRCACASPGAGWCCR